MPGDRDSARSHGRDDGVAGVMDNLVRTSFEVMAVLNKVAAAHDLSLTQLRVLAILRDRTPSMAELATHLGLERSSVSGLVDRAAGRGLVRRETSTDDGRRVHVSLTADGHRLAAVLVHDVAGLMTPMTGRLGAADLLRLGTLLDTLLH